MIYHSVFQSWNTMAKMFLRCKCYKGDPPNPNDPDQISPVEFAQTRRAVMDYNQYVKDKPFINEYISDVTKDPRISATGLRGQANADLMQKSQMSNMNPNVGMPSFTKGALLGSKISGDLMRDTVSQKAAVTGGILANKMGQQSNVNASQDMMAKDAVERNLNENALEYGKKQGTTNAMASLLGAGSSAYYNRENKKS